MKNKKGFTLIELLAVIVILAIIALIATPIILNMIKQARMSAAKSAALGYIDAIDYNNGFAQLGTEGYTAVTSGNVSTITSTLGSHLKGKAPTSGSVVIDSNGKVTSATLCINGYNVTYENKDATVGGSCSSNSNNQQAQETTSTCPGTGCKYVYVTGDDALVIGESSAPEGASDDYTTLNRDYFIGIITNPNTGIIERAFSCGLENGTPICLEGHDTTKWESNITRLNTAFPSCNVTTDDEEAECTGTSVEFGTIPNGHTGTGKSTAGYCYVFYYGEVGCGEL